MPIEIWWTPTHYGDASADEYAEIKRGLERNGVFKVTLKSTEWAQYSERASATQYNVFQLGWFPDYPDAENYLVPFYRSDTFTANGYKNPKMEALIKKELGREDARSADRVIKQIQLLAAQDVPIIPYWQQSMIAVGRNNVRGIPAHARPDGHHAVLAVVEVVDTSHVRCEGASPAPLRSSSAAVTLGRWLRGPWRSDRRNGQQGNLAQDSTRSSGWRSCVPMVFILLTMVFLLDAGRAGRPDLGVARRARAAERDRRDQGRARIRRADLRAVRPSTSARSRAAISARRSPIAGP